MRDLRAELLTAEAAHFAKTRGASDAVTAPESTASTAKRQLENEPEGGSEEDLEAKRRRILEATRDIDADSDGSGEEDSSDDDRLVNWSLRYKMQG